MYLVLDSLLNMRIFFILTSKASGLMVHPWNGSNGSPIVISFVQQMLVTDKEEKMKRNIGQEKLLNVNSLSSKKLIMEISVRRIRQPA